MVLCLGLFSLALSNCSVNILPQNFLVNMNPPSVPYAPDVGGFLDGIVIDVVLVYAVFVAFCSHLFLCFHILSSMSITLINIKAHPGGYEYCPADLAVTVVVQLLL